MKKEILEKTAKEYYESAQEQLEKGKYNSAVVLFFKALVSFTDLLILNKTGQTSSSHNDRFRKTREQFPEIYNLLDKDFPFYQGSYVKILTKELAEVIKDDAKIVAEKCQIKLE